MSEENLEIVRRVFDAVARRDTEGILALYDPTVEYRSSPGTFMSRIGPRRVYRGHHGLRAFNRELHEAFETIETTCDELIDAGDRVVSKSRYWARGRGSGVEIDGPVQFGVWTFHEGRVVRTEWFATREEALEAAGLSE
ncbi:MAG: nuclear transport factor 2 family protein [Solirubrobacterales bacterium]